MANSGPSLPFPFEKLVDLFEIGTAPGSKYAGMGTGARLLIPQGRSLQKEKADFQNPRFVYGNRAGPLQRADLFMAYAKKAEQIEIISWDPDARAYRFLIIEDYAKGKTPKIKAVEDGSCFICHQNKGPILSRAPWREMVDGVGFHAGGKSLYEAIHQHHSSVYEGIDLEKLQTPAGMAVSKKGKKADGGFSKAIRLGELVEDAAHRIQDGELCRNGCGENIVCRQFLLKKALESVMTGFSIPEENEEAKKAFQKSWTEHQGFAFSSPVLPDRDPLQDPLISPGFKLVPKVASKNVKDDPAFDPTFDLSLSVDSSLNYSPANTDLVRKYFNEIPLTPEEISLADPANPRPLIQAIDQATLRNKITAIARSCIWSKDEFFAQSSLNSQCKDYFSKTTGYQAILGDKTIKQSLSNSWPPNPKQLIQSIAKLCSNSVQGESKQPESTQGGACVNPEATANSSTAIISQVKTIDAVIGSGIHEKLERYCGQCHGPKSSMPFPLDNLNALKQHRGPRSGKTFLERIQKGDMPPVRLLKIQAYQEWEKDRTLIMDSLK